MAVLQITDLEPPQQVLYREELICISTYIPRTPYS